VVADVTPPKNTGGGGFVFENDVCAWLLACVLTGERVFGPNLGEPVRLDFQTLPDGWLLDDILVTTAATPPRRLAFSIKSNAQFRAATAPGDFVEIVWTQWLGIGSTVFKAATDFMGIITGPVSAAAQTSIRGLVAKIRDADPNLFPARMATPHWASEEERDLFASFTCPGTVTATPPATPADTVRVLQHLHILHHDFGDAGSATLENALQICRRALRDGESAEAERLWNALRARAAELRPAAGHITRAALAEELRGAFLLADFPNHGADWQRLDRQSKETARQLPTTIADTVELAREGAVTPVLEALAEHDCVALIGASGVGKSVVARTLFETRVAAGDRTLWLDAAAFERPDFRGFEASLGLTYPLSELLPGERGSAPLLIVDGLDRLYSDHAFRNAAQLLRLARQKAPATQWYVLVPCQAPEWPRVLEGIERAGFLSRQWMQVEIERLSPEELAPVGTAIPALAKLLLQPRVANLLGNLKLLDLVARRVLAGAAVDAASWVGESSVAAWFWTAEVERGADKTARAAFARRLAQAQGDRLLASVPVDDFNIADLSPAPSLSADRICVEISGARLTFCHDLYGDWARLQILLSRLADLPDFLRSRRESPLWHRAVRLLGVHLLERDNGVEAWRAVMASFGAGQPGAIHDLLLEAPIFTANSRRLLEAILPDLLANEGALLRRMLGRFLAFATMPDLEKLALAKALKVDLSIARAQHRLPYWPHWLDMLRFVHAHRDQMVAVAPGEVARVIEMWLDFPPAGKVLRREAAEVALLLGELGIATRNDYGDDEWKGDRKRFYTCALAAAPEKPDEVARIALVASERLPDSESPPSILEARQRHRNRGSFFRRSGTPVEPWPDGPRSDVDDEFQSVVLDTPAILPLCRVRPAAAREVILATLIEPPDEDTGHPAWGEARDLDLVNRHSWQLPMYINGPFLGFLNANFAEGLELIARLVDFAASRLSARASRHARDWRAQAEHEGRTPVEIQELVGRTIVPQLVVPLDDSPKSFEGGPQAYGWSAGLGTPPEAVQAALMALEQWLYVRIEAKKDVTGEVQAILARGNSTAFLAVLCDIGRRDLALFEGPLRPLLAVPEIYSWEIDRMVNGRSHFMIGAYGHGEWFLRMAQKFHELPHRKYDLRRIARVLMIEKPGMREYFATIVAAWRKEATADPTTRAEGMRAQLMVALDPNPENYAIREDPQHGAVLVNIEEERIHESQAEERKAWEDHWLITGFPMRCRTMLDKGETLSDADLETMWTQWCRIRELARSGGGLLEGHERFGDEFANAIAGGAAVFLSQPPSLLGEGERRDEVLVELKELLARPPSRGLGYDWNGVSDWSWDCFAAEALAILWVQEPAKPLWRDAVARMVFFPRYLTLKLLYARCAEHRAAVREDFARLRRLALEWAYLRDRVDLLEHVPREALQVADHVLDRINASLAAWQEEKIAAFVSGTSHPIPADWAECDDSSRFGELDEVLARWRQGGTLNFHIVRCAHDWLPLPEKALDEAERGEWLGFWRSALTVVLARPAAITSRDERPYPREDESWLLQVVAALVLQLRPDETPAHFWQPIIDLTGETHDWPEMFLRALHRSALGAAAVPLNYVPIVRDIVKRAFTKVDGKERWHSFEDVWETLLGMDPSSGDLWKPEHGVIVAELADQGDLWMQRVSPRGRRLKNFAYWLSRPAAVPVRLRALKWLLGVARSQEKGRDHEAAEAADALANLLNIVWDNDEARLRANDGAFAAFRGLLGWLVDRQNVRGLELLGRIGSLG
jgi:hypothetical protein